MNKILMPLIVIVILSCTKTQTTSTIDFVQEIDKTQFSVMGINSLGMITSNDFYDSGVTQTGVENNPYGNFNMFMIHQDGGQEWVMSELEKSAYTCPTRYNGSCDANNVRIAANRLLIEDQNKLIEFAKWVFFIDKQFLESFTEETDGGIVTTYNTIDNSSFEVVLYQQLPGETVWIQIDIQTVNDDQFFDWKINFRKYKEEKYN